jgi:hypothetical protein
VLPSVWSPALLAPAANPALQRIVLAPAEHGAFSTEHAPLGPRSLWLRAARAHARLFALVRAGTPLVRERARTVAAPMLEETDTEVEDKRCVGRPTRALSASAVGA